MINTCETPLSNCVPLHIGTSEAEQHFDKASTIDVNSPTIAPKQSNFDIYESLEKPESKGIYQKMRKQAPKKAN